MDPVDIALCLAMDVSASVDFDEFALMAGGTAAAFRDPSVLAAATSGPRGAAAVCLVLWSGVGGQDVALGWTRLEAMSFYSMPFTPERVEATEARLEAIYAAARYGLKGDSLALRVDHPGVRLEVTDDTSTVGQLFSREYGRGARAVAMVGVTTPSVPVFLLHHAFRALQFHRVVVGPSFDDGTWLVGAQRPAPDVIDALAPGHATALLRAEPALRAADVALGLLPYWFTTDDDLIRLRWHLRQPSTSGVEVIATKTLEVLERDTLTATASGS
jgi:hypothetical protein